MFEQVQSIIGHGRRMGLPGGVSTFLRWEPDGIDDQIGLIATERHMYAIGLLLDR